MRASVVRMPPPVPYGLHTPLSVSSTAKLSRYASGLLCDLSALSRPASPVTAWADVSGQGNSVTAGTATSSTTGWASDGGPCVTVAATQYMALDSLAAAMSGDWSFAILFRRGAGGAYHTLFSLGTVAGTSYWQPYISAGNTLGAQVVGTGASSGLQDGSVPVKTTEDTLAVYSWNASTKTFTVWCNGQKGTLTCSSASGLPAPTKATVASLWNGIYNNPFIGNVRRFAAWSRQFTDQDWRTLWALWGLAHPGTGAPHRWRLFVGGNSILAGYNGTVDTYPLTGLLALPPNVTATNTAVDSRQASVMLANLTSEVLTPAASQPCEPWGYYAFELRNTIFFMLQANSSTPAATCAAQAVADYYAVLDAVRAAGGWPIASTAPDCTSWGGGILDTTGRAALALANASVRATWQGHGDDLVDVAAFFSNATDGTKFVDGIHLTQAGEQELAQMVDGAVRGVGATALSAYLLTP